MIDLRIGDSLTILKTLPAETVQTCVTSPPYYNLRDYGINGQIGLEQTPIDYVAKLVEVFAEVRRVLKPDGTLWLNLGDSYSCGKIGRSDIGREIAGHGTRTVSVGKPQNRQVEGMKPKDLLGMPWRVAFALQARGWYLRSDIIWHKPNPMPESVTDRPTKAHEYLFLFAKNERYYYDADAIREPHTSSAPVRNRHQNGGGSSESLSGDCRQDFGLMLFNPKGRNRRTVWTIPPQHYKGAHFATFPRKLVEPCILAGSRQGDTVLDPFSGAATTGLVAQQHGRDYIGLELNPAYVALAVERLGVDIFADAASTAA